MTREEQIKKAAVSFCRVEEAPDGFAFIPQSSFVTGALWADAHPNWEAIVKRLQKEITNDLRQDRWISVEDELPKETNMYLVVHHNVVFTMWWYDNLEEWAEIFVDENENIQSRKMDGVTHWMPLPEPPAGNTDEKGGEQ